MVLTFDSLALQFKDYTDVKGKIRREVQSGRLTQITRGLYETDARADGKYLAGAILRSVLSFFRLCAVDVFTDSRSDFPDLHVRNVP